MSEFAMRSAVLDLALAAECAPGRHHAVALHTYFGHQSGAWLFGRWQLFREALGPKYDSVMYWFTEYGVPNADGQSEGRGPANCDAVRAEMQAADAAYRAAPEVGGYHAYSVGESQEWTDLTPCLRAL